MKKLVKQNYKASASYALANVRNLAVISENRNQIETHRQALIYIHTCVVDL